MIKALHKRIKIPSILKIGPDELIHIGKYLKTFSLTRAACFFSNGIKEIAGNKLYESFENYDIQVVHEDFIDRIDIENIIHTAFSLPKSAQVLIGIGGGKALDFSKYCAHVLNIPFITVPTSVSNDGFCSPVSSLIIDGKRSSVNSTIPFGVVVDIKILQGAPDSLIYSGTGDLISKVTAGYDWQKAAQKGNSEFHDFAYLISQNSVRDVFDTKTFCLKDEIFLYDLANALLMNGLSMEIAGSSRPASGSEHLISHSYDKISDEPSLHGIQVGLATYLCSYLQNNKYEQVKSFLECSGFFAFVRNNPLNKADFLKAITLAPEAKEDFYTILSEKGMIEKAINFVETDTLFKQLLA